MKFMLKCIGKLLRAGHAFLGQVVWLLCGGMWSLVGWCALGSLACLSLVGIPAGIGCFKAAYLTLIPSRRRVTVRFKKHPVANILWAVTLGWIFALGYLTTGLLSCLSLVAIPRGLRSLRLIPLALFPFGATLQKPAATAAQP